jgi:hypothetical protein
MGANIGFYLDEAEGKNQYMLRDILHEKLHSALGPHFLSGWAGKTNRFDTGGTHRVSLRVRCGAINGGAANWN